MPGSKAQIDLFNTNLTERLKDDNFQLKEEEAIIYDAIDDNDSLAYPKPKVQNMKNATECDLYDDDGYTLLLSTALLLPNELADSYIRETVIKRAKNNLGQPIGTRHADANLDTRRYIVKISDGTEQELQHGLIATNMFTQANSESQ